MNHVGTKRTGALLTLEVPAATLQYAPRSLLSTATSRRLDALVLVRLAIGSAGSL